MKKLLAIAVVLVLAGQGCPGFQSNTEMDTDTQADVNATGESGEEFQPRDVSIKAGSESETQLGGEADADDDVKADTNTDMELDVNLNTKADTNIGPLQIEMESGNFFFTPDTIRADAGQEVTVVFTENDGFHTFVIDELDFKETVKESGKITFTAPNEPGSYAYYCDIGTHRAMGMEGTLIVE